MAALLQLEAGADRLRRDLGTETVDRKAYDVRLQVRSLSCYSAEPPSPCRWHRSRRSGVGVS